ncbi:hypothetical protein Q8A67_010992 [Cirrhinus molitorella]|uniref:Uncharacterized protein n=1 Tax=Cirrhinus molitorella TaxID=172907 RepID=A0AA88PQC9_9TELE|nr:hypothetical protein Q8A67_010992 [Cirrhinus molitorella]
MGPLSRITSKQKQLSVARKNKFLSDNSSETEESISSDAVKPKAPCIMFSYCDGDDVSALTPPPWTGFIVVSS